MTPQERFQYYWNHWDRREEAALRHNDWICKLMKKHGLETNCTDCGAIMPTSIEPVQCCVCNGDTCSPYYC